MYSYFEKGIRDCNPNRKISIERLVKLIKVNDTPAIKAIRALDATHPKYTANKVKLKRFLPNITPCCTVTYRDDASIKEFSGYMYFDIDKEGDALNLKSKIIEKYRDFISMICLSCSGQGLSFFTKVENEITADNFDSIRRYICEYIFTDLNLDPQTKSKSNAWYISYDPDCYYNPSAIIEIPEQYILTKEKNLEKSAKHNIITSSSDCLQNALSQYERIPITEVIKKLKFKTEVEVKNRIFDMRPVDYCHVFLPPAYKIPDGKKHAVFAQIIHNLYYMNPDVDPAYIFNYIKWLNKNKTVTEATFRDLQGHFNFIYNGIKNTGEIYPVTRTKIFHCKEKTISPSQRRSLAIEMASLYKRNKTIEAITIAKELLEIFKSKSAKHNIINPFSDCLRFALSKKPTQQEVHDLIEIVAARKGCKKIGIRTIKKYWKEEQIDLDAIVKYKNKTMEITYIPIVGSNDIEFECDIDDDVEIANGRVLDTQILDKVDSIHYCLASNEAD
ncbi:hypothetical protein CJD36_016755 [Flavipsychrobacter stenotrophus]|uniref:BT4734-like N-terminal domain-containing protein n=1 Tax=Flavipsychrobacter stenotrophus TaxID=2077091 RepID=A0A2S7SRQ1_9BACT|nr:BT4734/BF3469 family protein [Flavipsychrobacter stenotrophus]PQJ09589.1 hypothetical protein CJD36_016755 [Flavipsychrobacter stenotrophus]